MNRAGSRGGKLVSPSFHLSPGYANCVRARLVIQCGGPNGSRGKPIEAAPVSGSGPELEVPAPGEFTPVDEPRYGDAQESWQVMS